MGEFGINAVYEFELIAKLLGIGLADVGFELTAVDIDSHLLGHFLFVSGKEVELLFEDVVDTLEAGALVDRPREGAHLDLQLLFELVEEVERVLTFAVHLVDEDDYRRLAHAADRHELARLGFDTLGTVDNDDGRVDGGQGTEGIFGKVLVTRRVEDVDLVVIVVKLHD